MKSERKLPKVGDIYRHFKGRQYLICGFVINATNGADTSPMVLYIPEDQLFSSRKNYFCRTVEEFLSPVDKEKYPNATQYWRFEEIRGDSHENN